MPPKFNEHNTLFKVFCYLGITWYRKPATVKILQEIKGEKKYGINTTGADEIEVLAKNTVDISNATIYIPVSYNLIENVLTHIPENCRNHFLDIGCGKGSALCVATYKNIWNRFFSYIL